MTPSPEEAIDVFHSRADARPTLWVADWADLYDWSCAIGSPLPGPWLLGVPVGMPGEPGVLRARWDDGHTVDLPLAAPRQTPNPYRDDAP